MRTRRFLSKIGKAVITGFVVAGCTTTDTYFPIDAPQQAALSDVTVIKIDAANIDTIGKPSAVAVTSSGTFTTDWEYAVGVGDVLSIIVFDHPELTLPAGPERSAVDSGFRVQSDGTFFYPFVGQVPAAGRSLEAIRGELTARLTEFIAMPQIEVRVAAFNSQRVIVAGEVVAPNQQRLTMEPLTLIDAINAAGGLSPDANLNRVLLQRNGQRRVIDLEAFLSRGDKNSNPVLRAGDVVTVAELVQSEAYLLGEVGAPAIIDLTDEHVSLTAALAGRGGLDNLRADARGVFVFRDVDRQVTVYQLDARSPVALLLGTRFKLRPNDVIYVTTSPLQRWNDTISQLLPSVRAVPAIDDAALVVN